ncbi:metallophosphoesterase [Agromyces atrinae]|uniref:Phosphodiesterase n=1 Tax=Agromyces atrinae TaxID=592376 RepID=A0A4Q2M8X4_9MICO|nr:metallophosphoesterase [Agromyces atrinae]NYD68007.1 3',5'-cyclic AMP phosphodiesterase CpdA [Agromyces atrinae]RXZ87837.1 phosphodiesterase [Agromyces atrinae]
MSPFGQHPPASHVIAHLSDPHFLGGSRPLHGAVDQYANLDRTLATLEATGVRPAAIVFTGDLTDLGEPDAYVRLRETVEPVASRLGAEVVWVMGNHDERAPFAELLLDADGDLDAPQDRVHEFDGLRIIALDSTVPGYHHGEFSDAQLAWLADELQTQAPHGTLLAMHHPPIPTPLLEAMAILELQEQERLADVIRGTDVRGILGGHLHYSTHSTFAGVPVSVASASCYTLDLAAPGRLLSGVDGGQSFDLVHVYADRLVHSTVPLVDAPEVSVFPESARVVLERMTPAERLEAFSNKRSTFDPLT